MKIHLPAPYVWICGVLIGLSILFGISMPWLYELSEAEQSRASPYTWQVLGGLALVWVGSWVGLGLLHARGSWNPEPSWPKGQYSLRGVGGLATLIAVLLGIGRSWSPNVAVAMFCVLVVGYAVYLMYSCRHLRWLIITFLAVQYGPTLWSLHDPYGKWTIADLGQRMFFFLAVSPTVLPWIWLIGVRDAFWPFLGAAGSEILVGLMIIRMGPKRAVAFLVAMLILSLLGSFVLQALVRA